MARAQSSNIEELLTERTWVRNLARSLVGELWADDLAQETMLAAMRAPPAPGRPARPWLASILRNLGLMHLRSRARGAAREASSGLEPSASTAPDAYVAQIQMQRMLCEVLLELSEPLRRTLVEHYFHGRSFADIARLEGSPEGTIRWRHKEGLERLRRSLDDRSGGDRRAWAMALLPLAVPKTSATTVAGILGVTAMKKTGIAGLALLMGAVVVWLLSPTRSDVAPAQPERTTPRSAVRLHWPSPSTGSPVITSSLTGNVLGAGAGPVQVSLFRVRGAREEPTLVARSEGARFDFGALAAGTYCVTARAEERQGSECGLRLEPGERRTHDLQLVAASLRLRGVVRDAGAGPVPRPRIVAQPHPALDEVLTAQGGDDGSYTLSLRPGWYRVSATGDGYTRVSRLIELSTDRELNLLLNPAGLISGRVLEAASGAPAGGATVVAQRDGEEPRTTQAGADGRFEFSGLGAGRFRLVATLGARSGHSGELTLTLGETLRPDIRIAESGAFVEGKVMEAGTGRPLPGIEVRLDGLIDQAARTDDAGGFRMGGLVPDEYVLTVAAEDFVLARQQVLVPERGRSGVVLSLQRGATVRGSVKLPSGAPASDVIVESSAWALGDPRLIQVRTGSDGSFTLAPLEPGRVKVAAYHPSHGLTETVDVTVETGKDAQVELSFSASASVAGKVQFDDGSSAIGALVSIASDEANASWTTIVGGDGSYRVDSLPAGTYFVSVRAPSTWAEDSVTHDPSKTLLTLASGERKTLELKVQGGHESIHGRVVDAQGAPVAGAAIWAERIVAGAPTGIPLGEIEVYTWDDGSFSLEGLPRGEYLIGARHVDHARGEVFPIRAGTRDLVLPLRSPGRISGQVLDQGRPVTAFKLSWSYHARRTERGGQLAHGSRVFVHPEGRFELSSLAPSESYELSADTPDGKWGSAKKLALAPAGQAEVRIEVKGQGTVRGRLVDAQTGRGAVGFQIYFGYDALARTDGAGTFETRIPAGRYERFFPMSSNAHYPPVMRAFEVKADEVIDLGDIRIGSPAEEAHGEEHGEAHEEHP
jgi:RNA polymerase sigma-70 factor (ECF subfamily)